MDLVTRKAALFFTNRLTAQAAIAALQSFIRKLNFPPAHFSLVSDWASELRGKTFSAFCEQHAIRHLLTNPLSPNKMANIERLHRSLRSIANRQLQARKQAPETVRESLTPISYRVALERAVKIYNSTPSRALGGALSPDEMTADAAAGLLVEKEERRAKQLDDYVERRSGGGRSWRSVEAVLPGRVRLEVGAPVRVLRRALNPSDPSENPAATSNKFAKEHSLPIFSSQVLSFVLHVQITIFAAKPHLAGQAKPRDQLGEHRGKS